MSTTGKDYGVAVLAMALLVVALITLAIVFWNESHTDKAFTQTPLPNEGVKWLEPYWGEKQPNGPTFHYYEKDTELELDLGLRADGVVVWRKHQPR